MQNIVILAGNIGQNPETRTTQGGTKITNFTLATSRPRLSEGRVLRDENGYRIMDTEWHRITCFNGLGKTVAEHCEKGMKVMVHGRIHYTSGTTQPAPTATAARSSPRRSTFSAARRPARTRAPTSSTATTRSRSENGVTSDPAGKPAGSRARLEIARHG